MLKVYSSNEPVREREKEAEYARVRLSARLGRIVTSLALALVRAAVMILEEGWLHANPRES